MEPVLFTCFSNRRNMFKSCESFDASTTFPARALLLLELAGTNGVGRKPYASPCAALAASRGLAAPKNAGRLD